MIIPVRFLTLVERINNKDHKLFRWLHNKKKDNSILLISGYVGEGLIKKPDNKHEVN
jgi:hypothetical protein